MEEVDLTDSGVEVRAAAALRGTGRGRLVR
jgi:hypothetical protein